MIRASNQPTRPPWRCNSGRTANIATRTYRRLPRKRASALTSARSARTAPKTGFITSARTAAAVLSRGQSGRQRSGDLDYRLRSGRRRRSGCISPTVSTRSRSIRRAFGIFRQRNVEPTPSLQGAKATKQSSLASLTLDCRGARHRARIRATRWLAMTMWWAAQRCSGGVFLIRAECSAISSRL